MDGNKKSCDLWDLSADREKIARLKHQFQPFNIDLFGISEGTFARGSYEDRTLFRFPLRKIPSKLSTTIFTPDDIYELFNSLESEAFSILLFLNSIEVIELYDRQKGEGERQMLSIKIADGCRVDVRNQRLKFRNRLEERSHEAVSVSFPVVVETTKFQNGCMTSMQKQCWAVSLYHAGREDCNLAGDLIDELKVRPIGGTAVLLYTEEGSIRCPPDFSICGGRIFCFLPLPAEVESPTGLNVHVNAYFSLEQNRRHLKWPSPNQDNDRIKERTSQWNIFLVEKVISKALIRLILYLVQLTRSSTKMDASIIEALDDCWQFDDKPLRFAQLIYYVMPNIDSLKSWWKIVEKPFYEHLANHEVFYCPQSGSKWVNAFCKEVIFAKFSDRIKEPSADTITKVLRLNELYLISVPDNVLRAVSDHAEETKTLTPSVFCTYFRRLQERNTKFNDDERFAVFDYLSGQMQTDCSRELLRLELIPLNNGGWTTFRANEQRPTIYIPNEEHRMLPTL